MALTISDDLLTSVRMSDNELLVDVACFLYDKERLSFGRAAKLSGLNQLQFQKELAKRDIYIKYTIDDYNTDLRNLGIKL